MTTPLDLAAIRARLEAAPEHIECRYVGRPYMEEREPTDESKAAYAAARTDVGDLLDECERLREVADRAEAVEQRMHERRAERDAAIAEVARLTKREAKLVDESNDLATRLHGAEEALAGYRGEVVHCPSCGEQIDPDWCHCGDAIAGHGYGVGGHGAVPMGCVCGYGEQDFVRLSRTLRERWSESRAEVARLRAERLAGTLHDEVRELVDVGGFGDLDEEQSHMSYQLACEVMVRRAADLSDQDRDALKTYADSLRSYIANEGEGDFMVHDALAVLDRLIGGRS